MALSISAFYRILKKTGIDRVSDEAAIEMRDSVEELAKELAAECVNIARHAERRTVMKSDVEFVFRKRHERHEHKE